MDDVSDNETRTLSEWSFIGVSSVLSEVIKYSILEVVRISVFGLAAVDVDVVLLSIKMGREGDAFRLLFLSPVDG